MRCICLEGFDGFVTSTAASMATGWSDPVCRVGVAPTEDPRLSRRTTKFDPLSLFFTTTAFATNDYRPIIASGIAFWLLGVTCLGFSCWRGRLSRGFFAIACGLTTLLVVPDLLGRLAFACLRL